MRMPPLSRSIAAAALLAAVGGCSTTRTEVTWQENGLPRHEHPWQDWWHYQFVYHPIAQAYYEPYTTTWFWYESGLWWAGSELPRGLFPDRHPVVVKTRWDAPFLQHDPTILVQHPCPIEPPLRFDPARQDEFNSVVSMYPSSFRNGVD